MKNNNIKDYLIFLDQSHNSSRLKSITQPLEMFAMEKLSLLCLLGDIDIKIIKNKLANSRDRQTANYHQSAPITYYIRVTGKYIHQTSNQFL